MLNIQNYSYYHKSNKKLSIEKLEKINFYYLSGCNAAIKSIAEEFLYIQIEKKYIDYITEKTKLSLDQILNKYKLFGFTYEYIKIKRGLIEYYIFELSLYNFKTRHTRYYGFCMIRHFYYYQNFLISYLNLSNNLKEKNHIFLLSYLQQIYNVPNTFITWGNYTVSKSFSELLTLFNKTGNYPKIDYNVTLLSDSMKIVSLRDVAFYKLLVNKAEKEYNNIKNNVYIVVPSHIKIDNENCVKIDTADSIFNNYYLIKNAEFIENIKQYGVDTQIYSLYKDNNYFNVPILCPLNRINSIFTGCYFYSSNNEYTHFSYNVEEKNTIAHVNMKIVRKEPDINIILNPMVKQKMINTKLRKQKLIDSVAVTCKKSKLQGKIKLCFGKDLIYVSNLNNSPYDIIDISNIPDDIIEYCKNVWKATTLDLGNIIYHCELNKVVDIDLSHNTNATKKNLIISEIKKLIKEKGGLFPI